MSDLTSAKEHSIRPKGELFRDNSMGSEEFRALAEKISFFAKQANRRVIPYLNSKLPLFTNMSEEARVVCLNQMRTYVDICQDCLNSSGHLSDTKSLAWSALKYFKLRPSSSLFNYIKDGDIVEIYSFENIQIFRNFDFFDKVSYTIEDLYCRPWTELFHRPDPSIVPACLVYLEQVQQKPGQVFPVSIPTHLIEERDSIFKFKQMMNVKFVSGLVSPEHSLAAYIVIEDAKLVECPSEDVQASILEEHNRKIANDNAQPSPLSLIQDLN